MKKGGLKLDDLGGLSVCEVFVPASVARLPCVSLSIYVLAFFLLVSEVHPCVF